MSFPKINQLKRDVFDLRVQSSFLTQFTMIERGKFAFEFFNHSKLFKFDYLVCGG